MIANFHINYRTKPGGQVVIRFRREQGEETLLCQTYDGANWHGAIQVVEGEVLEYKYGVHSAGEQLAEHGDFRSLVLPTGKAQVFFQDFWRPQEEVARSFFSAAFKDVIFRRAKAKATEKGRPGTAGGNRIVLQLYAAALPPQLQFCVLGSHPSLGEWKKPMLLADTHYPLWQVALDWESQYADFEYKFAIHNPETGSVVEWETGDNRHLQFSFPSAAGNALVRTDESYRYASSLWRGTGMAIPVFSLRSEKGLGIGEYADLKPLVDWAVKTGMRLVQTLPVNDTIATKTWTDSYPYAAISVFALHPLYVNIQAVGKLKDKKAAARLQEATVELNKLPSVDFEAVLKLKFEFFHLLFAQEKAAFFKNAEAVAFMDANADWLKPYAAFCHLRDLNGTTDFNSWPQHAVFSQQAIDEICSPSYKAFDEVALYYFIQYHAHRQLLDATEYARKNGVVLKGDLPIGIYRQSCDAWVAPHLYNMDGQAGAPPDPYSDSGQNWGFPTYNWEVMAADGFAWWQQRMTKLAEYFDALRIDHILGFFRIWQIPTHQVEGTLGLFNPRMPYTRQELAGMGLHGNLDRFTKPYIRGHFLPEIFDHDADFVRTNFLEETSFSVFKLREEVDNQGKIKALFSSNPGLADKKHLEKGLMRLVSNVLLIEEPLATGLGYNPRITLNTTRSYKELGEKEKGIFDRLYNDYFYQRHDEFWRQQALWKLPALLQATNMLICGEDLGMIPKSVPGVMAALNILSLEIQRMPKGFSEFGAPEKYPYTSVCSPSCHDMPTIRGWWENDPEMAQRFFHDCLRLPGTAPVECTPGVVQVINRQHLASPSMWAIFPVQDLVGMDARLRHPIASAEQINDPSISPHYWRFRFHLPMEQLLQEEELNEKIRKMVADARRG